MTVSTFFQTDFSGQSGAAYFPTIDADIAVMSRTAAAFSAHQTSLASMAIMVNRGAIQTNAGLVEMPAQTTAALLAPSINPRIDRVVIDRVTATVSVIAGIESANPQPPAIPFGGIAVARVALDPGITSITNAMITDERALFNAAPNSASGSLVGVQVFSNSGSYVPTAGVTNLIVEIQGGGGSGGSCAATGGSTGSTAGGGSAGAFARARISGPIATTVVTVGAGGSPAAAGANRGNPGGTSSFGNLVTAPGGRGGYGNGAFASLVIVGGSESGNPSTGGDLVNTAGAPGSPGLILSPQSVVGGGGGCSVYGGGGANSGGTNGLAAVAPGAGGSGGSSIANASAKSGGAGAAGLVTIYEFM